MRGDGRLDLGSADEFGEAVGRLLEQGIVHVVVDLTRVHFMDSSGVGALVSGFRTARDSGGDLKMCGVAPQVAMLLERTNLDQVILECRSVEHAYGQEDFVQSDALPDVEAGECSG